MEEIKLSAEEEQELAELEIIFEANGGRGVEIADRIDVLRAKRDGCIECGNLFDDNPNAALCKTCEDWLVTE